ncbi:CHAP domain-containing protein [Streptacidiphilus sp. 4-A2]|nr:CHAP domain-containing protein [Streptacidiphilus sp. 4-A2]
MFDLYSNGDKTAPEPGDVLSFGVNGSGAGHTGVVYQSDVDSSGNGTVYFVDQNWTGDGGYNSASVSDWNVENLVSTQGGTVQWLHNPSDTPTPAASYEVAFQANASTFLYTRGSDGTDTNTEEGMMAGTSPAITYLSGGCETAFQANNGFLYTYTSAGAVSNTEYGMMAGTSPAITTQSNGDPEIAFQANTGMLETRDSDGSTSSTQYGMLSGTSPAITALSSDGYEIAFQANTGFLDLRDSAGTTTGTGEGLDAPTSPVIVGN